MLRFQRRALGMLAAAILVVCIPAAGLIFANSQRDQPLKPTPLPELARSSGQSVAPTGPIELSESGTPGRPPTDFVIGDVVAHEGNILQLQTASTGYTVRVEVPSSTRIARERAISVDEITVGDTLDVSGDRLPDGTLRARMIGVNAANVRGPILEIRDDGSWLVEERSGSAAVHPTGRVVRIVFDPARPATDINRAPYDPARGRVGDGAFLYGVWQRDGSVLVTSVVAP